MKGFVVVLTGIFPEVGGGTGLQLGSARVAAMIESFGGKVTSSVSAKTDILVVGKEPGFQAVTKARRSSKVRLITLQHLKRELEGGRVEMGEHSLALVPPVRIDKFSAGYRGNGSAADASPAALHFARFGNGSIQGSKYKAPSLQGSTTPGKTLGKRPLALMGAAHREPSSPSVTRTPAAPATAASMHRTPGASPSMGRTPAANVLGKVLADTPAKKAFTNSVPPASPALPDGWKRITHKTSGEVQFLGPDKKRYKSIPKSAYLQVEKRKEAESTMASQATLTLT